MLDSGLKLPFHDVALVETSTRDVATLLGSEGVRDPCVACDLTSKEGSCTSLSPGSASQGSAWAMGSGAATTSHSCAQTRLSATSWGRVVWVRAAHIVHLVAKHQPAAADLVAARELEEIRWHSLFGNRVILPHLVSGAVYAFTLAFPNRLGDRRMKVVLANPSPRCELGMCLLAKVDDTARGNG
eukprot:3899459-Prymnesium_polylepis.1